MPSGNYLNEKQVQVRYLMKIEQNISYWGAALEHCNSNENPINENITIKILFFQ